MEGAGAPATAGPGEPETFYRRSFTAPIDLSSFAFCVPGAPREGRRYELRVIQQPLRARMCGFGDKDRRPATPPPIVELIVRAANGRLIDVPNSEVSFYVLKCDLYSADGTADRNLVVHPSVTVAARVAARQLEAAAAVADLEKSGADPSAVAAAAAEASLPHAVLKHRMPTARAATGAVIRNLIGCLMASATKLTRLPAARATAAAETGDAGPIMGIYFVLQDLSVRTEGNFRFKFSFIDLRSDTKSAVTTGSTMIQTEVFSDQFTVYSAKNFPGMIESTPLSAWFSRQGVKIHARRDSASRRRRPSQHADDAAAAPEGKRLKDRSADAEGTNDAQDAAASAAPAPAESEAAAAAGPAPAPAESKAAAVAGPAPAEPKTFVVADPAKGGRRVSGNFGAIPSVPDPPAPAGRAVAAAVSAGGRPRSPSRRDAGDLSR